MISVIQHIQLSNMPDSRSGRISDIRLYMLHFVFLVNGHRFRLEGVLSSEFDEIIHRLIFSAYKTHGLRVSGYCSSRNTFAFELPLLLFTTNNTIPCEQLVRFCIPNFGSAFFGHLSNIKMSNFRTNVCFASRK